MKNVKKLAVTAMLFAVGIVLPFLTGQIPTIGRMLLPMHIPVLLCGFIVGWQYGAVIGFLLPIVRSLLFGMPPIYPTALAMAFEMAMYGFVSGFLWQRCLQVEWCGRLQWLCCSESAEICLPGTHSSQALF